MNIATIVMTIILSLVTAILGSFCGYLIKLLNDSKNAHQLVKIEHKMQEKAHEKMTSNINSIMLNVNILKNTVTSIENKLK